MENLQTLFLPKKRLRQRPVAAIPIKIQQHFVPVILHSPLKALSLTLHLLTIKFIYPLHLLSPAGFIQDNDRGDDHSDPENLNPGDDLAKHKVA